MENLQETTPKVWFRAKRYGYGWYPASFEGWVVMLVWFMINVKYFITTDTLSHSGSDTLIGFAPTFIITTIILLIICYKKGEKLGWRWGEPRDKGPEAQDLLR
jgi:hypothetical protein